MSIKKWLAQLGLGKATGGVKKRRLSPIHLEAARWEEEAKDQFKELAKKNLELTVFTL